MEDCWPSLCMQHANIEIDFWSDEILKIGHRGDVGSTSSSL